MKRLLSRHHLRSFLGGVFPDVLNFCMNLDVIQIACALRRFSQK